MPRARSVSSSDVSTSDEDHDSIINEDGERLRFRAHVKGRATRRPRRAKRRSRSRSRSHVRTRVGDLEDRQEKLRRDLRDVRSRQRSPGINIFMDKQRRVDELRDLMFTRDVDDEDYRYRRLLRAIKDLEAQLRDRNRDHDHDHDHNWERRFRQLQREVDELMRGRSRSTSRSRSRGRHRELFTRHDMEREQQLDKLKRMEKDEETRRYVEDALAAERHRNMEHERELEKQEKEIRERIIAEQNKRAAEQCEREAEEERLRKKAVEDFKKKEAEKKLKEQEEKELADKEFERRLHEMFNNAGITDEQICALFKKDDNNKDNNKLIKPGQVDPATTGVKVHRRFISPETLDHYRLPWEWHPDDADYILIHKWIGDDLQQELFEHTRRLKLRVEAPPGSPKSKVGIHVDGKDKDRMFLVRSRSRPTRRIFF